MTMRNNTQEIDHQTGLWNSSGGDETGVEMIRADVVCGLGVHQLEHLNVVSLLDAHHAHCINATHQPQKYT